MNIKCDSRSLSLDSLICKIWIRTSLKIKAPPSQKHEGRSGAGEGTERKAKTTGQELAPWASLGELLWGRLDARMVQTEDTASALFNSPVLESPAFPGTPSPVSGNGTQGHPK